MVILPLHINEFPSGSYQPFVTQIHGHIEELSLLFHRLSKTVHKIEEWIDHVSQVALMFSYELWMIHINSRMDRWRSGCTIDDFLPGWIWDNFGSLVLCWASFGGQSRSPGKINERNRWSEWRAGWQAANLREYSEHGVLGHGDQWVFENVGSFVNPRPTVQQTVRPRRHQWQ